MTRAPFEIGKISCAWISFILVLLAPSIASSQSVNPYSPPWLWIDNTFWVENQLTTTTCVQYSGSTCIDMRNPDAYLATSVAHYVDNTDLDLATPGSGITRRIVFENEDYGPNGYQGMNHSMRGPSTGCNDTFGFQWEANGNCDEGNYRSDNAFIQINDYYWNFGSLYFQTNMPKLIRHELGHIFGMRHTPNVSFMSDYNYSVQPSSLQSWEISWINSKY